MLPMAEPPVAPQDSSPGREAYYAVSDKVVSALQVGTVPWSPAVAEPAHRVPHNAERGNRYNVFNSLVLLLAMEERGYEHGGWLTEGQIEKLGATVRRGQDPTNIVQYFPSYQKSQGVAPTEGPKSRRKGAAEDGAPIRRRRNGSGLPAMKPLPLFNVAQASGLPSRFFEVHQPDILGSRGRVLSLVTAVGASVTTGASGPTYDPSADEIVVPRSDKLGVTSGYDARLLRQLARWAGHESRANWKLSPPPVDSGLTAAESLEADLAAAALCTLVGVQGEERRPAAIDYWLELLSEDSDTLFFTATRAEKAVAFLDKAAVKWGLGTPRKVPPRQERASLNVSAPVGNVPPSRSEVLHRPEKRRPKVL